MSATTANSPATWSACLRSFGPESSSGRGSVGWMYSTLIRSCSVATRPTLAER